ncbi:uncharacterized protein LOC116616097 [Nematostella vectensis]|uniref:uncharacterized protein LOC116616097 n=1 Tax=Nematostella vectensis TaxID=45351 RepID=UPI00207754E0|nr:uncharacterized protein LOC116616097 [Nematostella vectensis]
MFRKLCLLSLSYFVFQEAPSSHLYGDQLLRNNTDALPKGSKGVINDEHLPIEGWKLDNCATDLPENDHKDGTTGQKLNRDVGNDDPKCIIETQEGNDSRGPERTCTEPPGPETERCTTAGTGNPDEKLRIETILGADVSMSYPPAATRHETATEQTGQSSESNNWMSKVVQEVFIGLLVLGLPLVMSLVAISYRTARLLAAFSQPPYQHNHQQREMAVSIFQTFLGASRASGEEDDVKLWEGLFGSLLPSLPCLATNSTGNVTALPTSQSSYGSIEWPVGSASPTSLCEDGNSTPSEDTECSHGNCFEPTNVETETDEYDIEFNNNDTLLLLRPHSGPEVVFPLIFGQVYQHAPGQTANLTSLVRAVVLPSATSNNILEIFSSDRDVSWRFAHKKGFFNKQGMFNFALLMVCSPGDIYGKRLHCIV